VDDVESFVHGLNPELIAELLATAKRRKLVRDEERKVINHKYFTRTASERGVKTRGMEKKSSENIVEDNGDPEYNDYISKLQDTYDSGFQTDLIAKDPLPGSDTEEVTEKEGNGLAAEAEIPAAEPTPMLQPEPTSSSFSSTIVIDAENNPFTAIIESGTIEDSQGDAGHHLTVDEDGKWETIERETKDEGNEITELYTNHFIGIFLNFDFHTPSKYTIREQEDRDY
jgi:hypothetical protein